MHIEVAVPLIDMEAQLRRLRAEDPSAPEALASTQRFAVDYLTLAAQ